MSSVINRDIRNQYMVTVINKLDTFQEKFERHTPNEEYENFVTAHIEAAAKCIIIKSRDKFEFHGSL